MGREANSRSLLKEILKPIAYADVFDYPLRFEEIYQFLEVKVESAQVQASLDQLVADKKLALVDVYYSLAHKPHLRELRQQRETEAQKLWLTAISYGFWIASLPFVRMVAVTGSLAVNNPQEIDDDIDYLVVTEPNRLWLCRALIILMVRYAHLQGVHLCPNYLLTESVLFFADQNLYTARELSQMVPLYGESIYRQMRQLNIWIIDYLPQGPGLQLDQLNDNLSSPQRQLKSVGQWMLDNIFGDFAEKVLQKIQITKHLKRAAKYNALDRVIFTPDICKGHYDGHNHQTMQAYERHINELRIEG